MIPVPPAVQRFVLPGLAAVLGVGLAVLVYRSAIPDGGRDNTHPQAGSATAGQSSRKVLHDAASNDDAKNDDSAVATDSTQAREMLPRGLTDIEGSGGRGVHRAVLKNGVWFPVFSPGQALQPDGSAAYAAQAEVALSITSGSPPHGKTGEPFTSDFEAVGGAPPYRWTFRMGQAALPFTMDPASGLLSGLSGEPVDTTLDVFVTDSAGAQDSAHYPLVIAEESALAMVTMQLASAASGSAYATRLEASGGTPPYTWTVDGVETAGLMLTPNTGELGGTPMEAGEFALQVTVTDQLQATVTRALTLTVTGNGLRIATTTLPDATTGTGYTAQLSGEGGTPPYTWTMTGNSGSGFLLDATTGALSGMPATAGELTLEAHLTDQQGTTVTRQLALTVSDGLEIATASPLFPASPGLPYQLTFTATGGKPPYRWELAEGVLPADATGRTWTLSPEGVLAGLAGPTESAFRFAIEVKDSSDRSFKKTFDLPLRQGLLAIPSREKIGLAWRPYQIDGALRSSGTALVAMAVVRSVGGFPQTPDAGVVVYQGAGGSVVDRNLPTGGRFFYTLFVQTADGRVLPFSTAAATILPMTLQRGQAGVSGDPFADRVVAFQPLTPGGYGAAFVPANITGPPDGRGTFAPASGQNEVASLHARVGAGGSVTLEFTDNIVELGSGVDFTVFENVLFVGGNATQRFMEPAVVWVALFDDQWYRFPIDVVPPAPGKTLNLMDPFYYNKGFAGRNGTTGADPTNPAASGGDSFDVTELAVPGLTWIRYVRIQSTGDSAMMDDFGGDPVRHTFSSNALSGDRSSGFDLDAVSAVNY